jgi:hypothetical protein
MGRPAAEEESKRLRRAWERSTSVNWVIANWFGEIGLADPFGKNDVDGKLRLPSTSFFP